MAKDKKRSKTLPEIVFQKFRDSGDVTGLGVLADWYEERDEKPELVALLRSVFSGERHAESVQFFAYNTSGACNPAVETQEEATFRYACRLRDAEEWLMMQDDAEVDWMTDTDADRYGIEHDGPLWAVVMVGGGERNSLGGIDFAEDGDPWTDDYARVIEAELALELMEDDHK